MLVLRAGEAKNGVAEKVELVPKYVEDVLNRYQDVMPKDLPTSCHLGGKWITRSR